MPSDNRRQSFRIVYPSEARPAFAVAPANAGPSDPGIRATVLDWSEFGLRVAWPCPRDVPTAGTQLSGRIRLRTGHEVRLTGVVVRVEGQEIAMRLEGGGVPLAVLYAEQRYLRDTYPGWLVSVRAMCSVYGDPVRTSQA
jgi:hypothetical protein